MAKFKFKYGAMASGKSQELLRTFYIYNKKYINNKSDKKVLVLTSKRDDRFGTGHIVSRADISNPIPAITVSTLFEVKELCEQYKNNLPACVLIDEVQFFSYEMIEYLKNFFVILNNVPIIAYGLKNDFQNMLFPGTQACLIFAEEIMEIETICSFCNKKAIMNLRVDEQGNPIFHGEQVVIGDSNYFPVCHYHYLNKDL